MNIKLYKTILFVSGSLAERNRYKEIIKNEGYNYYEAFSLAEGTMLACQNIPDCVIVSDEFDRDSLLQFCRETKVNTKIKKLPLLIVVDFNNSEKIIELLRSGANDYFFRTLSSELIIEKIKSSLLNSEVQKELMLLIKDREDMLSITSHDLKSPIAFIEGCFDLILEDYHGHLPSEIKDLILRAHKRSQYALDLIHNILELGRVEYDRPHLEFLSIRNLLEECMENFQFKLKEKAIDVLIDIDSKLGNVYTDKFKLLQIINNILNNAITYTNPQTTITIEVKAIANANSFSIEIKDKGSGIPEQLLESIFQKYDRGNAEGTVTGTGLGLNICRNLCSLLGGSIWASNGHEGGTSFKIMLPGHIENPKVILICESSSLVRVQQIAILERAGYFVISTDILDEALNLLHVQSPSLIIMDAQQVELNSSNIISSIQAVSRLRSIPILLQSAYEVKKNHNIFWENGCSFMFKTIEEKELLTHVERSISLNTNANTNFIKILVFTNNSSIADVIQEKYEDYNCVTIFANNIHEAHFFMKNRLFDLIVVDLLHENHEQLEFLRYLSTFKEKCRLCLILDKSKEQKYEKHSNATLFLNSPVTQDLFKAMLKKAFDKTTTINETSKIKILLADTCEENVILLRTLFKKMSLDFVSVLNGNDAISEFKESQYDLVIIDSELFMVSCAETLKQIRELVQTHKYKNPYICVLTQLYGNKQAKQPLNSFVDLFINKPIDKNALMDLVMKVKVKK